MRPAGDCHVALVKAAQALMVERSQSGKEGATLLELAHYSQVGYAAARRLVPKLKRWGHLQVVGERKVPGRNRPAFEYAPGQDSAGHPEDSAGPPVLADCLRTWTQ